MSEVRRATPQAESWRDTLRTLSSEKISEVTIASKPVDGPYIEDYPYRTQEIIKGEFKYLLHRPGDREAKPIPMTFYFRTESQLFILDPGKRDNLSNQVLKEFENLLTDKMRILSGSSVSRRGIWNFIESAERIRKVRVKADPATIDPTQFERIGQKEGVISFDQIPSEDITDKKVERAELDFDFRGRFNAIYSNDILSISGTKDQFEYAVQKFELEAIFRG